MESADGLPVPQRYWAMVTVVLAVVVTVLDGAIANVALPTIARDLDTSPAASIWVVNAYQLAVIMTLLSLASLGDIFGYRRVYCAGLVVFTLSSFACAASTSLVTLTLARILQGLGAAGVFSVNTALVRFIFPSGLLGRGIGINALVVAVAAALGPTVASAILSVASWPWLFAVNVPIGIVALFAAPALPRTPRGPHRFDWVSAVLNALTFGLLITGIDGLGHSAHPMMVAAELGATAVLGFAFIRRQLSLAFPLLPVDLLRRPIFALSVATSTCSFTGQMLAYVSLPFYLQGPLGRTAVETGLLMTPWPLATAVVAPIAGRLADRYSAGTLGGIGLVVFAAGLVLLALLPDQATAADIAWRMAVCGLGFGLFQSPNNRAIISSAPRNRSGGASGMLGTARTLGLTMGAALAALMFRSFPEHATTLALVAGAGCAVVAAGVSCLRLADLSGLAEAGEPAAKED